jgi:hypothetical protein
MTWFLEKMLRMRDEDSSLVTFAEATVNEALGMTGVRGTTG